MKSSFEIKERIRESIDIVDLISSHYNIPLQSRGRIYVGRCPWHDDNRPSLQVNPERQTYRCWVCDIGGDIFSFVEQYERVDFKEALEILADKVGISLPKYTPRSQRGHFIASSSDPGNPSESRLIVDNSSTQPVSVPKRKLYNSLNWLAEQYHQYYLISPEASIARQYIRERGITEETARRFKIGYAPFNTSVIFDWIRNSRDRARTLIGAGVLAPGRDFVLPNGEENLSAEERSNIFDRFRGRVIFPIRNTSGQTVAFGGRILPNSQLNSHSKYINSPETSVFFKSKMFYGLDLARNAIRAKNRAIITEGYTDTIMAHQYGLEETVAVLGVALGSEHVTIINRFADKMKIYLVLDGDAAGRRRADEVLKFFVAQGADMSILTLPDNQDPCEFLLAHGKEGFEEQIAHHATDALDHAFEQAVSGIDLSNIIESTSALDSLLSIIALAPPQTDLRWGPAQLRISKFLQRLSEKFRISEDEIHARFNVLRKTQNRAPSRSTKTEIPTIASEDPILPIPQFDDETPEKLAELFGVLPNDIWTNRSFMPTMLEIEFFTFWWTCPELFPKLTDEVTVEDFHSPVSRQIFLLGADLLKRGINPVTFDAILSRYNSPTMISCLDTIAEKGTARGLSERLANEENRKILMTQILNAFLSQRIKRAKQIQVNDLREDTLDQQSKDKKLLALQQILKEKQNRRDKRENSGLMDEDAHGDPQF